MTTPLDAVPDASRNAPVGLVATRPLYWSVRRELWENRWISITPLVFAAVFMFGFLISLSRLTARTRAALLLDAARQRAAIERPYDMLAMLLLLNALIVGLFYCLDALYGERRDRSILFWKSLPVSDLTTVLSKLSIPLVVLPLLTFAVTITTQAIMLLLSSAVLLGSGLLGETWRQLSFFQSALVLLYGLIALALWHAPIYAWLLLVSVWARRAPFLWAVLPVVVLCVLEKIALNSAHFAALLKYRLVGHIERAFAFGAHGSIDSLAQLTLGTFLGTAGLWIGLVCAGGFVAAAIRLRRYREPI